MKKTLIAAASGLALAFTAAPAVAQDDELTSEEMAQVAEMFGGVFAADPLTAEQQARLPKAEALMAMMMPEGFYAEMMSDIMGSTFEPMIAMISGETGAGLLLGSRLNLDPSEYSDLSGDQKVEIASLLDPGFSERGQVMQEFMSKILIDVATDMEPGFRAGMAKAYAVRFDDGQLDDLAEFFATPTGKIFATENMKLMADPQVMSATMEAMPQMMQRFGSLDEEMEAAMNSVPAERAVEDLEPAERARIAELLGVGESELGDVISPPTTTEFDEAPAVEAS